MQSFFYLTILKIMKDIKRPLRYFHGIGVCESKLKICCTPYDSNEKNIYVEEKNIFDESNHDKSFVFSNISGDLKLVEIHYFGKWEEYEFLGSSHWGWVPEIKSIEFFEEDQIKAFKVFKKLLIETEKINGFSIMDKRHDLFSDSKFRSLLIRILNSKIYKSIN